MRKPVMQIAVLMLALSCIAVAQNSTVALKDSVKKGAFKDRIAIQELIYKYAYVYDAKDCVGYANLFTTDGVLDLGGTLVQNSAMQGKGRDAIRQVCVDRQSKVVGHIRTHHYMTNIVFDKLTASRAETRSYLLLTWQKPGETTVSIASAFIYRDIFEKSGDGKWLFKERRADDLTSIR
jgi:ketosteroid isomerase-like protein